MWEFSKGREYFQDSWMSVTAHSRRFSAAFLSLLSFIRILSFVTNSHVSAALGPQRSVAPLLSTGNNSALLTHRAGGCALARHWSEYLMESAEFEFSREPREAVQVLPSGKDEDLGRLRTRNRAVCRRSSRSCGRVCALGLRSVHAR